MSAKDKVVSEKVSVSLFQHIGSRQEQQDVASYDNYPGNVGYAVVCDGVYADNTTVIRIEFNPSK